LRWPDPAAAQESLPDGCAIVAIDGRTWSYQCGHDPYGAAITTDSIWPLYCMSKPLVAAAALALERLGDLDLDARLRALAPWRMSPYVGSLTPAAILDHRTHLPDVPGLIAFVLSDEERWRTVYGATGSPLPVTHSRYSVFCGFFVIGHLVEHVTGLPLGAAVSALVTEPIGVEDVGFADTREQHAAWAERLVVPAYRSASGGELLPATGAMASAVATRSNAAFGAFGSVRGLGAVAAHLAAELVGTLAHPVLSDRFARTLTAPFEEPDFDATLGRVAQFRCGFEVDVGAHGFGTQLGPTAIGHASEGGGITFVIEPGEDRWLVAAAAALEVDQEGLRARRERVVDRLVAQRTDGCAA
jgi:CubicO group peptidase (beta-lactamase class C family)